MTNERKANVNGGFMNRKNLVKVKPVYVELHPLPVVVQHILCLPFPCSHLCSLSAVVSFLICPSLLSFPVTGNSHNCRPKCLSTAGGSGDMLGQEWMLSSSSQQTKDATPHLQGCVTYTANWRSRIWIRLSLELRLWSWQIRKNAWLTTAVNWGGLSGVTRSSTQCVPLDRGFLSSPTLSRSVWRTWKVGLDRWCNKPCQTQSISVHQQARSLDAASVCPPPRQNGSCMWRNYLRFIHNKLNSLMNNCQHPETNF